MLIKNIYLLIFLLYPFTTIAAESDSTLSDLAPKIYLDGSYIDYDFIRSEITFVNYVIDRKNADVHILITQQHTGSGGHEYTLSFIGLGKFSTKHDTIVFTTLKDDTYDLIRKKMVKYLKIGLLPYVVTTTLANDIDVVFTKPREALIPEDRWKNWIFSIKLSGALRGEESSDNLSFDSDMEVNRITEEWKIRLILDLDYSEENYEIDDETIFSDTKSYNFDALVVRSINNHWSIGAFKKTSSTTYDNEAFSFYLAPTIEYNFYPYSESTRRELRFKYSLGFQTVYYEEETIYNKLDEIVLRQSLSINLELKQPWGRVDTRLSASHYFHDYSRKHVSFSTNLSFKLVKGFSFYIYGGLSMIHNQLSIPKRDITKEEVLLRRRQLETQYSYKSGVGFEFTFGSIYNNIVNPRFGN